VNDLDKDKRKIEAGMPSFSHVFSSFIGPSKASVLFSKTSFSTSYNSPLMFEHFSVLRELVHPSFFKYYLE
jgi:hypothetical protein